MKNRYFSLTALALALLGGSVAQAVPQVFVDEDFEGYTDTAALEASWLFVPGTSGSKNLTLIDQTYSTIINSTTFEPYPLGQKAFDPTSTGATGKGVEFVGSGVLELDLPTINGGQPLLPTAEKSVVFGGDIFDVNGHANMRRSLGLRNSNAENLIEMGFWNTSALSYAARAVNFGGPAPDPGTGGWFFFELDPSLDGPDAGTTVTPFDIGEAWHRYEVIVTPTSLTYTFDLYRDGINNATEATGVDYSITYEGLDTTAAGFNKIRFGGPSGNTSTGQTGYGGVVFDNIYLALEDAAVEPPVLVGDYNGDLVVDAADYTVWRDTLGTSVTTGTGADANGNGVIDGPGVGSDYEFWANNYGATSASSSVTIPEPASLVLVALGLVAVAQRR
jgi:hypothetical protein